MTLETENGKETITFSTVSRPYTLPEDKDGTDGRRRKKPSKVKKYRERKEAWLERRRTVLVERPAAEVTAVAAPTTNSHATQVDSTHPCTAKYEKNRYILLRTDIYRYNGFSGREGGEGGR